MKQVKAQFKLKAGALLRDARNPNDDSRLYERIDFRSISLFVYCIKVSGCADCELAVTVDINDISNQLRHYVIAVADVVSYILISRQAIFIFL